MKKLIEQLNTLLIGEQERSLELRELKLGFIRKEKEILHSIQLCKKSGGIIGMYSPVLGKGMILCTVLQILQDNTVVIRPIDPNVSITSKTLINLSEVTCICPFNQLYSPAGSEMEDEGGNVPSQLNMFQNVN
jgi:hypothetical protein